MKKDKKIKCEICGKESILKVCKDCNYLLRHGASKLTIKTMLSDDKTNRIWNKNKEIASRLANAYYTPLLDSYNNKKMQKDSKENFGFNTFADGITLGLDIVMPLLDEVHFKKARDKIRMMLAIRENEK